ncbi:MAG: hypothetical protein P8I94_00705, partial [Emcibacteraceae bacterium]|nr:hypothetical protein [Emcibacteraceae bacterium]
MAETRPEGVTHGTWNKNPGNIKGYRKGGEKNDFTKWLDEKGIKYSKGTKAGDGGWFLKFENNADGLVAATSFWDVVKSWGTYKDKEGVSLSVRDALGVYAADGYDNVFLKNLEDKGIDLDAKLDSLSVDSLATISHHQMQTEDPNQYSELKKNGLITEDDVVNYENSELKKYQPKVLSSSEKLELDAQEAKDLIAKYKAYQNTKVTLDKDLKKDILSEIDKFSKEFADKSPKGWVGNRGAVPEMKEEYMTGINAILKDKTKDIDGSTPEGHNLLGEYNHLAYMHVANEDYGIQMGGNRLIDTNFEVMTEELRVGGQEFNALPRRYSIPQNIKDEVGNNEFIKELNAKEQKTTGSQAIGLTKRKPDLLSTEYSDEERNAVIDEHVRRQVNPTKSEKLVDKIEEAVEKVEDYNDNSTEEKRERSGKKKEEASEVVDETAEDGEELDLSAVTDTTDVERAVYDADGNAYDPDAPNFSGKGLVSKDDYNSWVD